MHTLMTQRMCRCKQITGSANVRQMQGIEF